jgi:hypothetical protein
MFQGLTFALLGTPGGIYDLELSQVAGHSCLHLITHADRGGLRVFVGPAEAIQLSDAGDARSTGTWDGLLQK